MELALAGTRALVTAGSRGLGCAYASSLAAEGARVVISSREAGRLEEAAADIGAAGWAVADLGSATDIAARVAQTVHRLGGLDVLVANCGSPRAVTFTEADDQAWDTAYEQVLMSGEPQPVITRPRD